MLLLSLGLLSVACKRYDPPAGPATGLYASCCDGAGMCLPTGLIAPGDAARLPGDNCGEALLCVPREAVGGSYVPARCVSVLGFEGRCLPSCLPELQEDLERLPSAGCGEAQRCAPCYDPISRLETGACSLGDDPGPSGPPPEIERCCGEIGRCVDTTLLNESEQERLGRDSCSMAALCVPEPWLDGQPVVPMSCRAVGEAEGRCLPACLPEIADRSDQLMPSGCPAAHLCTPCYDLLSGESTGACEIGDDPGPTEPPKVLANCCGDLGRCVPRSLVPEGDRARLGPDTCSDSDALCTPARWLDDAPLVPESCRAPGDLEGRCLPACLPEIAERASQLEVSSCQAGYLCAPCFDPLDGANTGACEIGDDAGPTEPAKMLAHCCGDLGRCVPQSLVPAEDRARLGVDTCNDGNALCAPESWIDDGPLVPPSCRAPGDLEGRCLPACLPEIAERADQLEVASCEAGYLCAPCFDPLDGSSTGACQIGDDPGPGEPPKVLGSCCGGLGRCVPQSLVPEEDKARLGPDSCSERDALCAPESWLDDVPLVPSSCRAPGDLEGRCLPACLPEIAERADQLERTSCNAGYLCAPCFDPLDGQSTEACEIGDDPGPTEPPKVFGDCCGDLGRCVPQSLVPEGDRARLGRDTCSDSGALCAPESWIDAEPLVPQSCRAPGDLEGRCLPACLPEIAARADQLRRTSCPAGYLCAPCFDPLDGQSTQACDIGDDPGPSEPPETFDTCCESDGEILGRCLPLPLLSSQDADRLPADSCDSRSERCVPDRLIDDPDRGFEPCRAAFEDGACIPGCMLSRTEYAILSQRTCPDGMRCAPCSTLAREGVDCP